MEDFSPRSKISENIFLKFADHFYALRYDEIVGEFEGYGRRN
jgi:hypothetical protein